MTKLSRGWYAPAICFACVLLAGGCGEGDGEDHSASAPPGPPGGMPGGGGARSPGIKQIMIKLAKGPNSLTPVIGNELGQDPPPWETIQAQTKEYSESASEMRNMTHQRERRSRGRRSQRLSRTSPRTWTGPPWPRARRMPGPLTISSRIRARAATTNIAKWAAVPVEARRAPDGEDRRREGRGPAGHSDDWIEIMSNADDRRLTRLMKICLAIPGNDVRSEGRPRRLHGAEENVRLFPQQSPWRRRRRR